MKTLVSSKKTNRATLMESASSSARNAQNEINEKRKHLQRTTRQTDLPRMIQKNEVSSESFFDEDDSSGFVVEHDSLGTVPFSDAFKTSWSDHTLLPQKEVDRLRQTYALPSERTSSLVSSSTEQLVVCIEDPIDTTKSAVVCTDTVMLQQMPAQSSLPFSRVKVYADDEKQDRKLNMLFDKIEQKDAAFLFNLRANTKFWIQLPLSAKDRHTGHTLVTMAVQAGEQSVVALICAIGASSALKNQQGKNAFQVAIQSKNLNILEFFFQERPDIILQHGFMQTLILDAVQTNQPIMLGYMLRLLETNIPKKIPFLRGAYKEQKQFRANEAYGHFKSECAPSKEETDLFRQNALSLNKATLLTVGLDLNKALSEAVSCGSDRVIPLLLEYGADLTLGMINSDSFSAEPLSLVWVAASKGHWACVDVLLRNGIALEDVNPMPRGWNGLCEAWKQLHAEVTERQAAMKDVDADCANSSADD